MKFEEKKFEIPELKGISAKNLEEHLKLYSGYVKNTNLILTMIEQYGKVDDEGGKYSVMEISRRFSFEYNGVRNHEIYFNSLSDGAKNLEEGSALKNKITEEFGSFEKWLIYFKSLATTRGIGWAMLYWDKKDQRLLNAWVDEQHIGQLQDCAPILALDMWEHAFVTDYQPSGKKQYIEDFFENLNWQKIEENFNTAQ
ncbi:MAG: Fe-Mn family superoxide dismutase [Candidatus Paceibacterota bacterium]|jgi:Fe-Mn family superoxide dismutase